MSSYFRYALSKFQNIRQKLKVKYQQVNVTKIALIDTFIIGASLCLCIIILYNLSHVRSLWWKGAKNDGIADKIREYNTKQIIYNQEIFGGVDPDTTVIVIRVHTKLGYLKYLIDSLYRARGIEKTLLIFSHDHFSENVNRLVHKTNFAKYMQIFYPYSIQTHLNRFPGYETKECFESEEARKKTINNLCNRPADLLQQKHHYWWTINTVFEGLEVSQNITNLVLFLEEGQIVIRDFINTLVKMNSKRKTMCPNCNILSLGTYDSTFKPPDTYSISISPFAAPKHNMGMAFNRTTWYHIRNCAREFCTYNDYNWDKSLQYISLSCAQLKVMMIKAARIYNIGICDTNLKLKNCTAAILVNKIQRDVKKKRRYLFPSRYQREREKSSNEIINPSGSWNDDRDHKMCMALTSRAVTFKTP